MYTWGFFFKPAFFYMSTTTTYRSVFGTRNASDEVTITLQLLHYYYHIMYEGIDSCVHILRIPYFIRHISDITPPKCNTHLVSLVYQGRRFIRPIHCWHFWIFSSRTVSQRPIYSCHNMFTDINGYLNKVWHTYITHTKVHIPRGYADHPENEQTTQSTLLKSHRNGYLSKALKASQNFLPIRVRITLYMSFQSALLHIKSRKGSFGRCSQALRAWVAPAWMSNR